MIKYELINYKVNILQNIHHYVIINVNNYIITSKLLLSIYKIQNNYEVKKYI